MANTALFMDESITRREERREDRRTAAEEHSSRISENYRKLLFDNGETWANASAETPSFDLSASAPAYSAPAPAYSAPAATATLERPVMPVHESVAPAAPAAPESAEKDYSANTAQRLADYVAYAPAQGKKMLFENIAYKNGELIDTRAAAAAPAVAPAPAYAPAPAEMPAAPAVKPTEDDAMPTRRTMDTLHRGAEMTDTAPAVRTGALSSLSLKAKVMLCAIAAAVVLIIALICINTGILSSANAEFVVKEAELRDLQTQYAQMQEELDYLQSDEYIDGWAEQNGMVRGD